MVGTCFIKLTQPKLEFSPIKSTHSPASWKTTGRALNRQLIYWKKTKFNIENINIKLLLNSLCHDLQDQELKDRVYSLLYHIKTHSYVFKKKTSRRIHTKALVGQALGKHSDYIY